MSTIPASTIVNVIPSVLSAGGDALVLNGLMLTENTRVPFGTVESFPTPNTVEEYFGSTAEESLVAEQYFGGFNGATQLPGAMLFAQYPQSAIAAYTRGGPASGYTLAQLQALSGNISIAIDGYTRTGTSVNLASANSFTAAATTIQTALNLSPTTLATFTGSIGPQTASFNGTIAGNVLNVTVLTSGTLQPGGVIAGSGVVVGTTIQNQLSGNTGGVGTYAVSGSGQVIAVEAMTLAYGLLTVSGTAAVTGSLAIGQTISGSGVNATTQIWNYGTASGTVGTYIVSPSQTIALEAMTTIPTPVVVTYDSVSGGFVITSGVVGAASSAGYASGSIGAELFLSLATGAVISGGSPGLTPATFMNQIINETQNWASFMNITDPDDGSGNTQKMAFATWCNEQDDRYVYICWDTDITPTESTDAAASMGQLVQTDALSGICLIWDVGPLTAGFICGAIASVDFDATNGRITFGGKSTSSLSATVTNALVSSNLLANGYNFYGAYATANQNFIFFWNGSVSGPFNWLDSFINQIWLNNQFQLDLMTLITQVSSIPYNPAGSALIATALSGTIQQALQFGAIRAGVTLSATQALEVNNAAGANIAPTLQNRGWYLLVGQASPAVRQVRGSPPCTFYYMDGESVQAITLSSIELE